MSSADFDLIISKLTSYSKIKEIYGEFKTINDVREIDNIFNKK